VKTLSTAAQNGADAFNELGLSEEFVRSASPEDLLQATIYALSNMEAGTKRTALATQLLGRSATDLAPLFNEGTAAIEEQMKMCEQYGMVLSDEAIANSAAFNDSLTTLQSTFTGVKNRVLSDLMPAFTDIMDGLSGIITGQDDANQKFEQGLNELVSQIENVTPTITQIIERLVPTCVKILTDVMCSTENINTMINAGIELGSAVLKGFFSRLGALGTFGSSLVDNARWNLGAVDTSTPSTDSGYVVVGQTASGSNIWSQRGASSNDSVTIGTINITADSTSTASGLMAQFKRAAGMA